MAEKDNRLSEIYNKLRRTDKNLYYMSAQDLIGNDEEATVDGTHFTDLGFIRMSDAIYPLLDKIVRKTE